MHLYILVCLAVATALVYHEWTATVYICYWQRWMDTSMEIRSLTSDLLLLPERSLDIALSVALSCCIPFVVLLLTFT